MTSLNQSVTEDYFNSLSPEHTKLIVDRQLQIYRNVNPVLTRRIRGRTLTLGSGSVMNFADAKADHVVCVDISYNMLTQHPRRPKISKINADAQFLPFDIGTFDIIVIPFLIHHIAQDDVLQTDAAISRMLAECSRILRRNGRIIIVDLFVSAWLEIVERTFYRPATYILNKRGIPMMYFYSLTNISALLSDCRLNIAFDQKLNISEKIMLTHLYPNIQIDAKYHPGKFHILEIAKL